jgi:hypothetical protein
VTEELGASFSLASTLEWGALPIVWAAADRRDVLDTYVQMYLKEEIQAEAATRNLPGYARLAADRRPLSRPDPQLLGARA